MLTATNNAFLIADRQKKEGKFFKIMGLTDKLSNEARTKPILLLTGYVYAPVRGTSMAYDTVLVAGG